MNKTRVEENMLALECVQKALDKEHGGRIKVVMDHEDTLTAVNDAMIPIPVAVIASTTRTPQRALKNVIVTATNSEEQLIGDVRVADSCIDAVKCMYEYLGRPAPVKKAAAKEQPVAPAPVLDIPTVVDVPAEYPKVGKPSSMAAYIMELMS